MKMTFMEVKCHQRSNVVNYALWLSYFISIKGSRYDKITKPKNKLIRQLKPNNIKGFKNSLSFVSWDYINNEDNPETLYSNFIDKTTKLLNTHCPP